MEDFKKLLSEFIAFKSISTNAQYKSDVKATAEWLKKQFQDHGFEAETYEGYGNPIVVSSYNINPSFKTCLIYGHYDVQPASQEEGWESDPFTLTERNGRFYARGAIDNKGQVSVHISTVFSLIKEGSLKYNVKFIIEGDEETGGGEMEEFLKQHKELLKADLAMVSDGEITNGNPTIELGFRGGFNSTLTVKTSSTDLHSGLYGGGAPSASHELIKILSTLHNKDNTIAIEGFYKDVCEIDEHVINNHKQIPFSLEEYKKISGTKTYMAEPGIDFYTQVSLRPAVEITGIQSGYVGEGYRNSIPATATAKINFRLVKNQKPQDIQDLLKKHIAQVAPEYVEWTLDFASPYEGTKLSSENEYIKEAGDLLEKAFMAKPYMKYCGGGLPIVTYFDEILNVPQVLVPLANEDCAMHAANENYNIETAEKALTFSRSFFSK